MSVLSVLFKAAGEINGMPSKAYLEMKPAQRVAYEQTFSNANAAPVKAKAVVPAVPPAGSPVEPMAAPAQSPAPAAKPTAVAPITPAPAAPVPAPAAPPATSVQVPPSGAVTPQVSAVPAPPPPTQGASVVQSLGLPAHVTPDKKWQEARKQYTAWQGGEGEDASIQQALAPQQAIEEEALQQQIKMYAALNRPDIKRWLEMNPGRSREFYDSLIARYGGSYSTSGIPLGPHDTIQRWKRLGGSPSSVLAHTLR